MKFVDKEGRDIYLEENLDTIYAYNCIYETEDEEESKEEIGYIQFLVQEQGGKYEDCQRVAYPEQAHVNKKFQRSGIATKIIEYAKEIYDLVQFYPDTGCGGNTDEIHYSDEGKAFKDYCEENGITKLIEESDDDSEFGEY